MFIALIAKRVEDAFREGIYEENVKLNGYSYLGNKALRKKCQRQSGSINHHPTNIQLANRSYLILTYNAEYDRIYYPLSLPYYGKSDSVILMQQIR
ncbi:unnamed protein product [Rotaria sp. Silwood2]|nr:unnamed protein product [Rotaria sp. Silwood2]CAF3149622.1 unnamed protein product [Rotaria sp. Silwood2]CAF3448209.1 unnamed protein product [Rotaria sp. Silwood2]CAF4391767.1 unnamed protein product [Rotaria sp. Silwood2]CAF4415522.1 unnamed protein product [Rotaria sp. Silwood2]